jgi:hypothetical protein
MPRSKLILAVPTFTRARRNWRTLAALDKDIVIVENPGLPLCFQLNVAWRTAMQMRRSGMVTHFASLAEDVIPRNDDWLLKLYAIMEEKLAQVVSVVIPIKNDRGLTSTALDTPRGIRRFTMHEIFADRLPTWGEPGLLVNTGCMLVDVRGDWCLGVPGFRMEDSVTQNEHASFVQNFMPEDWLFSRDATKAGARIVATRDVPVRHLGEFGYENDKVWGVWQHDREAKVM